MRPCGSMRFLEQKLRGENLKSSCGLSAAYVKTLCCLLHAVLSDAADRGLCAPLPPLHYHVLRHTFASRCMESGIDVKSLSELLGHANAAVTLNIYVHSSLEQKRAQPERLSAFLRM